MCVKQTIITANINEEETVLHIYPMLLFCFFSCILFVNCSVHRNLQVSTSFILRTIDWYFSIVIFMHSRNKHKRYLMQVYSFLEFYVCLNEIVMFVIYYTFDVLVCCRGNFCIFIFMIPYWWRLTFEASCIQINAVYLGMIHGEPKTLTLADLCVHYQIPTSLQWLQPFCKYNNVIPRPHHKINHNIIA